MKSLKNTLHRKTRESLDFALGHPLGGSHASPNLPRVSIHLKYTHVKRRPSRELPSCST